MTSEKETDALPDWPAAFLRAIPAPGPEGERAVLDESHLAVFRPAGRTLAVSFEEAQQPREAGRTLAHVLEEREGWSSLSLVSLRRTWFRSDAVIAHFDALTDEGFFDEFDRVLFAGVDAGPGYAAAAYSVAAPGAVVLAVHPVATLERTRTRWERRFRESRTMSFGPRYGYAPDMVDAAERAYVLSDPETLAQEMHASLFHGRHVTHLAARHAGNRLPGMLRDMDLLAPMAVAAVEGALGREWPRMWRARRGSEDYASAIMGAVDAKRHPGRAARLARWVLERHDMASARRLLSAAEAEGAVRMAGE